MKYFGGCDVGSTYTKAVILDENGKMCADTTIRSKINAEQSAITAMQEVCDKVGLKDSNSRPDAGIVTFEHRMYNQRDELVCVTERTALMQRKPA